MTEVDFYSISIASRCEFNSAELHAMFQFRAEIFQRRLGWDVHLLGGMEVDAYDALDPIYLMMRDRSGRIYGCLRMLPTTGPYMLKDAFPALLHGAEPPSSGKMVELSRFAARSGGHPGFGLSSLTVDLIRHALAYGQATGIEHYVTVTTPAVERLLRRSGMVMQRMGAPCKLGAERALALIIDISQSQLALQRDQL